MSVKSLKTGTRTFSMLAGNTPEHHVLLAETTVGAGGAASVTFSNIPADYQHLQVRGINYQYYGSAGAAYTLMRLNGNTGNNYRSHELLGDGSTASSTASSQTSWIYCSRTYSHPSSQNIFGGLILDILDYSNTSKNTTVRSLNGYDANGSGVVLLSSGVFLLTDAVTSILISGNAANFQQYSTFQLYGVK